MGFDGDVGGVAFSRWDQQRLVAVGAVALEVGEGLVQFAAGCCVSQFTAQPVRNQLAAIEHQAMFELLGFLHVGRGHQQCQLRAFAAYAFD